MVSLEYLCTTSNEFVSISSYARKNLELPEKQEVLLSCFAQVTFDADSHEI